MTNQGIAPHQIITSQNKDVRPQRSRVVEEPDRVLVTTLPLNRPRFRRAVDGSSASIGQPEARGR